MVQNSLLECEVGGRKLKVTKLTFSYSAENSLGSFEADLDTSEFEHVNACIGKVIHIKSEGFERFCLLESVSFEPQQELSIGGRDQISIMLDSTARPASYADGISLSSLGAKVCGEYGFSFEGKDRRLEAVSVNKGESSLSFLERVARPYVLVSEVGADIKVYAEYGKLLVKEGFRLTGLEYTRNIAEVFESYETADSSHPWMPGWVKEEPKKAKGSGPKGKRKLFFSSKADLDKEARQREEQAETIRLEAPKILGIRAGMGLDVDILGVTGEFRAKSVSYEIGPDEVTTTIEGVKA